MNVLFSLVFVSSFDVGCSVVVQVPLVTLAFDLVEVLIGIIVLVKELVSLDSFGTNTMVEEVLGT
jgi:hypothetical protein